MRLALLAAFAASLAAQTTISGPIKDGTGASFTGRVAITLTTPSISGVNIGPWSATVTVTGGQFCPTATTCSNSYSLYAGTYSVRYTHSSGAQWSRTWTVTADAANIRDIESSAPASPLSTFANNLINLTSGHLLYGASNGRATSLALGTSGYFLKAGASAPSWAALAASDVASGVFAIGRMIATPTASKCVQINSAGTAFEAAAAACGTGGGTWGSITGTLSSQTDLQTALDAKVAGASNLTTATRIMAVSAAGTATESTATVSGSTITATLTGNASTATALAADPANCSATQAAGGITAAGAAEGCIDLAGTYAPIAKGVTNGDSHDHSGGDGAQINHTGLSNIGTNTHAQIDTHLGSTSNPHSVTAAQAGALADPGGNGIAVRTAANTTTARSVASSNTGFATVSNADGTGGNPTIAPGANVGFSVCTFLGNVVGASSTNYFMWNSTNATETIRQAFAPLSGTAKNLYARTSTTQNAGGSLVFTLRVNAADTALTCTVPAGDGGSSTTANCIDTSNSVSVTAGDRISIKIVNNYSGGNSATIQQACFAIVP